MDDKNRSGINPVKGEQKSKVESSKKRARGRGKKEQRREKLKDLKEINKIKKRAEKS